MVIKININFTLTSIFDSKNGKKKIRNIWDSLVLHTGAVNTNKNFLLNTIYMELAFMKKVYETCGINPYYIKLHKLSAPCTYLS